MRFIFFEFCSRLDTVDSRVSMRVVSCVIFSSFCFKSFISSAICCSYLVVVAFMSSKFLHRWFSDCLYLKCRNQGVSEPWLSQM